MSYRKTIEAEINRYDILATRLEGNLKNISQSLVSERNDLKVKSEAQQQKILDLDRQNVELKAINNCMDHNQKLFERQMFPAHDQGLNLSKIFEAANKYGADRASDAGTSTATAPAENQTPRQRDISVPKNSTPAADGDVVNLDDDEEPNTDQTCSR